MNVVFSGFNPYATQRPAPQFAAMHGAMPNAPDVGTLLRQILGDVDPACSTLLKEAAKQPRCPMLETERLRWLAEQIESIQPAELPAHGAIPLQVNGAHRSEALLPAILRNVPSSAIEELEALAHAHPDIDEGAKLIWLADEIEKAQASSFM